MAKVIQNFLIGIGLDTREFDKGTQNVDRGLGGMRTKANAAGTALAGAFAGVSLAAVAAGKDIDRTVLATEKFNTSKQFIYNYGHALKALGGDANEAVSAIESAEEALRDFRLKGSFSAFEDSVFAGVDTQALSQTQTGEDFLRTLSDMLPTMTKDQQNLVQSSFGLSDAAMRSLRDGSAHFDSLISRAGELAGPIDGAAEAARSFNREMAEFGTRLDSISNSLAEKMLPSLEGVLRRINNFLDENKAEVDSATTIVANNPAIAGGAAAAAGGAALRTIGLGGRVSGVLSRLGMTGMLLGAGSEFLEEGIRSEMQRSNALQNSWKRITGQEVESEPVYELMPVPQEHLDKYGTAVPYPRKAVRVDEPLPDDIDYASLSADERVAMGMRERWLRENGKLPEDFKGIDYQAETMRTAGGDMDVSPTIINIENGNQQTSSLIRQGLSVPKIDNQIDLNVTLNGRALETEVTDIINRREQFEYDTAASTTRY